MVFLFIAGNGRTHSGIAFRRPLRWDPCPKPRTRGRTQNVSSPQQTTLPPPAVKDAESVNGGASKAGGRRPCPFHYTGGRSRGKATAQLREAISFHKAIRPSRGALHFQPKNKRPPQINGKRRLSALCHFSPCHFSISLSTSSPSFTGFALPPQSAIALPITAPSAAFLPFL